MEPISPLIAEGLALHALALSVSVLWLAWSVQRHGWRKRSTRRSTYYLYVALHSVRLWWLAALARSGADGRLGASELRSPTAAVLNRVALCLGYHAFSMIVFGWANVTSGGALRARWAFSALTGANWLSQAALCAALCATAGRGPPARAEALAQLDAALLVAFAALLSGCAALFGLLLSSRFIELAAAAADPTMGSYVAVKFNKVNLAWHAFCGCFALRAAFLAASLAGVGPAVSRAQYFWLGYYVPDVVPTLVALVVLRKRALQCGCCGLLSAAQPVEAGSGAGLHQQLIFSSQSQPARGRLGGGGSTGGSYSGASDGSESGGRGGGGGGHKSSSGGE